MLDSSRIFTLIANIDEPRTIREAMGMCDVDSWMEAMNLEMATLNKNDTWDLVTFPKGHKLVGCKWVLKKTRSRW